MNHREKRRDANELGDESAARRTHYRWVICALLFFATTINYLDRFIFGVLGPRLTDEYGWTEKNYSFIVGAFMAAYAIGYTVAGSIIDRIGERKGLALAVAVWSAAAMAHGLVGPLTAYCAPWLNATFAGTLLGGMTPALLSVAGFSAARFALGLAEGGHFPGAIKTVGQWHPTPERALSTGIFNSGSNMGIILAAYAAPFLVEQMKVGWEVTFYLTGALGFVWLAFWLTMYEIPERHPRVSAAELAYIRSDPADPPDNIAWLRLLRHRQTWACALGKSLIDPIWWFYLFWLPKFLKDGHGIDLNQAFWPLLIVYLMANVGSVAGGGISSWLIARGATVNAARKSAFLLCALCVVPVVSVARIHNVWAAVLLVGVAAAAHQGFSANLLTMVADTVPRKAISSVLGIGGTIACLSMLVFSMLIGYVLDWTEARYGEKDYLIPFLMAGSAYLAATAVIHLLLPRMEPMALEAGQKNLTTTEKGT